MTPQQFYEISNKAISNFHGNGRVLESALGALMVGQFIGWRPLLLMHGSSAIKRYQAILGVDFQQVLPEEAQFSERMPGYQLARKMGKYWDSVRGIAPGRSSEIVLPDVTFPNQ